MTRSRDGATFAAMLAGSTAMNFCRRDNVIILLLTAAIPVAAPNAQPPTWRPSVTLSLQGQDAGGVPRNGAAMAVGAWITGAGRIHGRGEVAFGGYSLTGGGILCPQVYPSNCGGPGGFPELLTISTSLVIGRLSPMRGPHVSLGLTGIQGFGNVRRHDRRAVTPDAGIGLPMGRTIFVEARYRWLREWEAKPFRQFSLGLGWLRR